MHIISEDMFVFIAVVIIIILAMTNKGTKPAKQRDTSNRNKLGLRDLLKKLLNKIIEAVVKYIEDKLKENLQIQLKSL